MESLVYPHIKGVVGIPSHDLHAVLRRRREAARLPPPVPYLVAKCDDLNASR